MSFRSLFFVASLASVSFYALAQTDQLGSEVANSDISLSDEGGDLAVRVQLDGLAEGIYLLQFTYLLKGGEVKGFVEKIQVGKITRGQRMANVMRFASKLSGAENWYFARVDLLQSSADESETLIGLATIWRNAGED